MSDRNDRSTTPPMAGGDEVTRADTPQDQPQASGEATEGIKGVGGVTLKVDPQKHGWKEPEAIDYDALAPLDNSDYIAKQKYESTKNLDEDGTYKGDESLESMLYSMDERQPIGKFYHAYLQARVKLVATVNYKDVGFIKDWDDERIHPLVRDNIKRQNFLPPFPVQFSTVAYVLAGCDVMSAAQTAKGSGKTAAFLVPILSLMLNDNAKILHPKPNVSTIDASKTNYVARPVALIVAPTRELAVQIGEEAARFSYRTPVRYCLAYGGAPKRTQLDDLKCGCDLLIGTPGRLMDLAEKHENVIDFSSIRFVVLDEADEMVQDDWKEHLDPILSRCSENVQFMMFSATFKRANRELARNYMGPNRMMMCTEHFGASHTNIHQVVFPCHSSMRRQCLVDLLLSLPSCRTIIFANTQRAVDELDDFLYNNKFPCTAVHAGRSQREREDSVKAFRSGKLPILVLSGVGSRGLDLPNTKHVINYELPSMLFGGYDEYIHRIGRTGRMGHRGQATTLFTERDEEEWGEPLAKTLIDTKHTLPECLQLYAPQDVATMFEEADMNEELKWDVGDPDPDAINFVGGEGAGGDADGWAAGAEEANLDTASNPGDAFEGHGQAQENGGDW